MYNAKKWAEDNMEQNPDYYLLSLWSVNETSDGRARLEKTSRAVTFNKEVRMEEVESEVDVISSTVEFVRNGQAGKLQNGSQIIFDDRIFDAATLSAVKTILKAAGEKFSASTASSEQIILLYINMDDPEVQKLKLLVFKNY
jgi:hypothetical protein